MISNRSLQSMFYTLTISAMTALLLTGCGGSSSSSPTVETAAIPAISGTVTKADATPIDGVTVKLTGPTSTKLQLKTTDTTGNDGTFSVDPTSTGEHQLEFTGTNFLTQYKNVTVSASGAPVAPTIMSAAAELVTIVAGGAPVTASNTAGTEVTGVQVIKATIPAGSPVTAISLTLLTGVEIPSTLPTTSGKTLLPVGTIAMSVEPTDADLSNSPVTAIVPLPEVLKSNTVFTVYNLIDGQWKSAGDGTVDGSTITFKVTKPGTYMVMTEIDNIEDVKSEATVVAGSTQSIPAIPGQVVLIPAIKDSVKVTFSGEVSGTDKADIEILIKSFLEKQNEIQSGTTTTNSVAVPAVAQKLAAKLVCNIDIKQLETVYTIPFVASGESITVTVTILGTTVDVTCSDDGTGLSTGGTGSTG